MLFRSGPRIGVEDALEAGRELGRPLHLVDDGPVGETVRAELLAERGLAALARARERDRRELGGSPPKQGSDLALDPGIVSLAPSIG